MLPERSQIATSSFASVISATIMPFEAAISRVWPPDQWSDVTTLVAVSGGPDSVALLRAMLSLQPGDASGRIVVAHYNHRWRGAESDGDEAFVRHLAASLGLDAVVGRSTAPSQPES